MAILSNTVLHFHDLRHTFTTLAEGRTLPGSVKYHIHNWDGRLRAAVSRLESFMRAVLSGKNVAEVPPFRVEQTVNGWKMVPRDRIELSTPAFSGLEHSQLNQNLKPKT